MRDHRRPGEREGKKKSVKKLTEEPFESRLFTAAGQLSFMSSRGNVSGIETTV